MLSRPEQANLNLEQARDLRAAGISYREIARRLALTSSQLRLTRRSLSRAKAARTRLRSTMPTATDRDLPIARSVLPFGLREQLKKAGYRTLGDLADSLADPEFQGLEMLPGIGAYRARLVRGLLEHFDLLPGPVDLQAAVEAFFPEFRDKLA
ncbi:hypothetical protein [Sphingobium sp. R-21]|uniref:hypothetical protein n=1 Tax=Sphingobium sp. R-21 TaxID=3404056 RepID=UPI003CF626B8